MLAISENSSDGSEKVVEFTTGVMFLGTSHRGSPEFGAAGGFARSFLSGIGVDTTPAILDALRLKTSNLERAQERFSALWGKCRFRVKTFQEGLGLSGISIGVLGDKVVPDYSSSLGDHRERTETIQANHREMCRFHGFGDPGYIKVSAELKLMCSQGKETNDGETANQHDPKRSKGSIIERPVGAEPRTSETTTHPRGFTEDEKVCLQALWFPAIMSRHSSLTKPADNTSDWLFEEHLYEEWVSGTNREGSHGLLWKVSADERSVPVEQER
ncbi:hypothetical protein OQA88_5312 [Cercophora sp. LCS_1]